MGAMMGEVSTGGSLALIEGIEGRLTGRTAFGRGADRDTAVVAAARDEGTRVAAVACLRVGLRLQWEYRSCGKHCNGCPHGPYLFAYETLPGGKRGRVYLGR